MESTGLWNFRYNINNGRYAHDNIEEAKPTIYDNSNLITKEYYTAPETVEKPLPKLNPAEAWEDEFDD